MSRYRTTLAALALATALPAASRANDSEAEIALGGLTLKQSDSITMDSEDLFVSRDRVRVTYRFTNTSDAPVDTLVAFPLPDIPADEGENAAYWRNPADLKFRTMVDGKPVAFEIVQQASFKGRDVTARLAALKIPLNRLDPDLDKAINQTPKVERAKLIAEGLAEDMGGDGDNRSYMAKWSLRTNVTRRQIFPAKTTLTVEHEYAPLVGGSVGGGLDASQRGEDYFREKQRRYCIEKDWLASFDRLVRKRKSDLASYSEVWLGYVLRTGANWKGPIGDFRLVVDKGKPESLVSFCAEGVRKISPTRFEVRHANFTPRRDLDILIVDWLTEEPPSR